MIAWPWQKGGKELCPEGGRHDWEVVRSLPQWLVDDWARRELGQPSSILSPTCGEEPRFDDRVCLKCKRVELHAKHAIERSKEQLKARQTRMETAAALVCAAIEGEKGE